MDQPVAKTFNEEEDDSECNYYAQCTCNFKECKKKRNIIVKILAYILHRLDDNIDKTKIEISSGYTIDLHLLEVPDGCGDSKFYTINVKDNLTIEITTTDEGYYNYSEGTWFGDPDIRYYNKFDFAIFPNLLAFCDGFVALNLGALPKD